MDDKKYYPEDTRIIQDLEALKTMADPLRNQIMDVLTPQPMTVNEIAQKLGLESSKLYYHFNLLEKHGFIQVVDTTLHGNLIEKHYWVTAYHFKLDEDQFKFNVDTPEGTEQVINLMMTNLDATREDLRRSMYARHQQISLGAEPHLRPVINSRDVFNLSDQKAQEFHRRLHELVEEFKQEALETQTEETLPWALSIVLYPSFYFEASKDLTTGE
jgi:DNA-binding transcriptional ArsR family regulator